MQVHGQVIHQRGFGAAGQAGCRTFGYPAEHILPGAIGSYPARGSVDVNQNPPLERRCGRRIPDEVSLAVSVQQHFHRSAEVSWWRVRACAGTGP